MASLMTSHGHANLRLLATNPGQLSHERKEQMQQWVAHLMQVMRIIRLIDLLTLMSLAWRRRMLAYDDLIYQMSTEKRTLCNDPCLGYLFRTILEMTALGINEA